MSYSLLEAMKALLGNDKKLNESIEKVNLDKFNSLLGKEITNIRADKTGIIDSVEANPSGYSTGRYGTIHLDFMAPDTFWLFGPEYATNYTSTDKEVQDFIDELISQNIERKENADLFAKEKADKEEKERIEKETKYKIEREKKKADEVANYRNDVIDMANEHAQRQPKKFDKFYKDFTTTDKDIKRKLLNPFSKTLNKNESTLLRIMLNNDELKDLYVTTYKNKRDQINDEGSKVRRRLKFTGSIEDTYKGDVDELISWIKKHATNISITLPVSVPTEVKGEERKSFESSIKTTKEDLEDLAKQGKVPSNFKPYESAKGTWGASWKVTMDADSYYDKPVEVDDWSVEKTIKGGQTEVLNVYVKAINGYALTGNSIVKDLVFNYDFKLGSQK